MGTKGRQEFSKGKSKPCELCRSEEAVLFCRADFAFLCASCIAELYNARNAASLKSRLRQRGWTCVDCERDNAAAALFNEDDAVTAVCVTCDDEDDVHPLMRRHKRIIVGFHEPPANYLRLNDAMPWSNS
ncbi:Zinc finger protein CONSTANS-LIKE 1 [Morus notabilis]|uniref:Zinc finger protein CONSTANS-LIKE 1 n=1 Tax=Morus notabilis TaxID=981085 RepID=W9S8Y0_9ROSA|nr:Zinc finger protein CONSTANS-LIKE 1 [Morus notabilis]